VLDSLSDEETLRLVKNRLAALTCLDASLGDCEKLAAKYELDRTMLLNDYFGFDLTELSERAAFEARLAAVRTELSRVDKLAESSESAVPRALIAIKFKLPLFYLRRVEDFFLRRKNKEIDSDSVAENDLAVEDFYSGLFKLREKVCENESDFEKLCEIATEKA
jgi:hypothetical protein